MHKGWLPSLVQSIRSESKQKHLLAKQCVRKKSNWRKWSIKKYFLDLKTIPQLFYFVRLFIILYICSEILISEASSITFINVMGLFTYNAFLFVLNMFIKGVKNKHSTTIAFQQSFEDVEGTISLNFYSQSSKV